MGGFGSKQFIRNDKVDGQGKPVLLIAKKLNIKVRELDRIFHEFSKYENPVTHLMDIKYFFNVLQLPYMLFDTIIFQMFDLQKCGYMNFMDYLMVIWGLLSSDDDGLANLCFTLFDVDRSGTLHVSEAKYLVSTIWEFKPNSQTISAIKKIDQNKDGFITMPEFVLLSKHFPDMLWPVKRVRTKLRQKTVFTRFWKMLTVRRLQDFGPATVFHIMELNDPKYVRSSMDYLNLRVDVVPSKFIEQYKMTVRKKQSSAKGEIELPYEISTQVLAEKGLLPIPLTMSNVQRLSDKYYTNNEERKEVDAVVDHKNNDDELVVAKNLTNVKIKDKKMLKQKRNTAEPWNVSVSSSSEDGDVEKI